MDLVRRPAVRASPLLVAGLLAVLSGAIAAAEEGTPMPIALDAPGGGALTIANAGSGLIAIERTIAVEAGGPGNWAAIVTEMAAVERCEAPAKTEPVVLRAGEKLTVVPWRGFSCSGQCNAVCRANVYYGAGPFRFVVRTAGGSVTSGPFAMPAEPPR